MTDKKISQLTGATTPLAGTEVLPIVQGGSTVKVSAADITAGRSISSAGASLDGAVVINESGADVDFRVESDTNTHALFVDGLSSYVGVGYSNPAFTLDVTHPTDNGIARFLSGDADAYITIGDNNSGSAYNRIGVITNDMYFNTNNGERIRIDSSGNTTVKTGNLVIGTADKGIADSSGVDRVTIASAATVVNESGADLDFRVEGDTDANLLFVDAGNDRVGVGTSSPGAKFTVSGGDISASGAVISATNRTILGTAAVYDDTINGNATGVGFGGDSVFPTNGAGSGTNDTKKLGNSSFRWSEVFATNGTINTSDVNAKQDIASLDDAEKRVAQRIKGLVKKYRFKDAVAKKGDDARIHVGFIAQEIEQAFSDEGLDATRYGIFCRDVWYEVDGNALDDNKKAYTKDSPGAVEKVTVGLRYDQIFALIISAL